MLEFLITALSIYFAGMAAFVAISMLTAYCLARDRFADPAMSTHFTSDYPPGALHALWRDFVAMSVYYLLYPIGYFMRDPDENLSSSDEQPPVVFVHGWTETRATWAPYFKRFKTNKTRKLYALNMWPPDAPLSYYADQLDAKIADVLKRTRHKKVLLVGHSMGGILAREVVRRHGAQAVERIISIASPHQGTLWGFVTLSQAVPQMTSHCAYLRELAEDSAIKSVDVHSIAAVHDNLVIPFDNALLPGSVWHLVPGYGHVSVTHAPQTMDLVERLIYADPARTSPAPETNAPSAPARPMATPAGEPDSAAKAKPAAKPKAAPKKTDVAAEKPAAPKPKSAQDVPLSDEMKQKIKRKLVKKLSEG
jgi:triacylglycerol lipase